MEASEKQGTREPKQDKNQEGLKSKRKDQQVRTKIEKKLSQQPVYHKY